LLTLVNKSPRSLANDAKKPGKLPDVAVSQHCFFSLNSQKSLKFTTCEL